MANIEITALPSKGTLNNNDYFHIKDGSDSGDYKVLPSVVRDKVLEQAQTSNVLFNQLTLTADLIVGGLVDGRDISVDGATLDNLSTTVGLSSLTSAEVDQLENIDTNTISGTQWGYLGNLDQELNSSSSPEFVNLTVSGNEVTRELENSVVIEVSSDSEFLVALDTYSNYTSKFDSNTNTLVTINIASGTTISTQVLLDNGQDMSHIRITSTDAIVTVDSSALQTTFNSRKPLFGAANNSVLPRIACQFAMDGVAEETVHDGIYVYNGSTCLVEASCGVNNCGGYGVLVESESTAICGDSSSFTSCGVGGIRATNNSQITAPNIIATSSGGVGIDSVNSSNIDAPGADVSGAGVYGLYAEDSSTINAESATVSNSVSPAGNHAVYATGGSNINFKLGIATHAGGNNLYALDSSVINASGSTLNNAGNFNVVAQNSSTISVINAVSVQSATIYGLYAVNASTINANSVNASSCGDHNVYALSGSTINFDAGTASNSTAGNGIFADENSMINADGATAVGNFGSNFLASTGSSIHEDNAGASDAVTDLSNGAVSITGDGYVEFTGNVGIGVTPLSNKTLSVLGSGTETCFEVQNSVAFGMLYTGTANQTMAAGANVSDSVLFLSRDSTTSRSINAAGTINASGADYAEYLKLAYWIIAHNLSCENEEDKIKISKGDIVGIDSDGRITTKWSESKSYIVKSTKPNLVGGDSWAVTPKPKSVEANEIEYVGIKKPEPIFNKNNEDIQDYDQYNKDIAAHNLAVEAEQQRVDAINQANLDEWLQIHEEERSKVDRAAFCGIVPVNNVTGNPGDYIIPAEGENDTITGYNVSVESCSFDEYKIRLGQVSHITEDGRVELIVKVG